MTKDIGIPAEFLASNVFAAIKASYGFSDEKLANDASMPTNIFHYHGGMCPSIVWNDVQEIILINKYSNLPKKIPIPSFPTDGYNQHSHTSEYDGGVLPTSGGKGFNFAVFYPATGVAQAEWGD
jgi:hypothetical protein